MGGNPTQRQWSFDKTELTFRAFYFFFIASFVAKLLYLPIYLKQLGLSASYVGILTGMTPFIRGAGAPILGYVADKMNLRKTVFMLSISAHTLTPILLLIPRPTEPICQSSVAMETLQRIYNDTISNNTNHYYSNKSMYVPSQYKSNGTIGDIDIVERQSQDLLQVFFILLVIFTIGEFIAAPTKNLADSALLEYLDNDSTNYGKIRMWGNISQVFLFLIVSPLAKSNTVKVCNVPVQDDYGLVMFPVAITMLGAFVMGLKIDFKQNEIRTTKCSTIPNEIQESSLKDVFVNFRNITFIIVVIYFGVMNGVFVTFMFWYLTDINPSQATWAIGVAGAGRNIVAAIGFGYSGHVIRKLGVINTVILSLGVCVPAFVIYGLMSNPWLAIIPELMQNICYAFSIPACILFFKERSPDEYSATIQGIVYSCYIGIGLGLGAIIGGFLMDIIGGSWTFLVFGGVTMFMILFFVVSLAISKLLERRKNNKEYNDTDDDEAI